MSEWIECPGTGAMPASLIPAFDFDDKGVCPVCENVCGLMLNVDIGREVIKPHSADDDE